jgi:hypothetical protein
VTPLPTTFTTNALLQKPATADRFWDVPLNANADYLDGLAAVGRLLATPTEIPSASLNVRVTAGTYRKGDGTIGVFPGASSYTLPASSTVVLWLTDTGILNSSISFPTSSHVRVATVVTGATSIQSIFDERIGPQSCGTGLGFVLKSGDAVAGTFSVVTSVGATPVFVVNPDVGTLGFFGTTPAPQAPALAPLIDNSTGVATSTMIDVGSSYSQSIIDGNFASLTAKVNALIAALKRHGLMSS